MSPIPEPQGWQIRIHLGWEFLPSARMEALMQHFQAAGFSGEVSRLAAAPRRPSTKCMYDDRWLLFNHYAHEQGFDSLSPTSAQIATFLNYLFDSHGLSSQTVKDYRTCLASVLSHSSKAAVVRDKIISDIYPQWNNRPRQTPILP